MSGASSVVVFLLLNCWVPCPGELLLPGHKDLCRALYPVTGLIVQAFYEKNGSTLNKLQQKVFLLFSLPEHILYHIQKVLRNRLGRKWSKSLVLDWMCLVIYKAPYDVLFCSNGSEVLEYWRNKRLTFI